MKFTPLRKNINLIVFAIGFGFIISGFDLEETIQLITSKFFIALLVGLIIWSYLNYEIVLETSSIQLKKILGPSVSVEFKDIKKIELESLTYPHANWDMLYLYSGDSIIHYRISSFNKRKLLKELINISESNGVVIDATKLKLGRFEIF